MMIRLCLELAQRAIELLPELIPPTSPMTGTNLWTDTYTLHEVCGETAMNQQSIVVRRFCFDGSFRTKELDRLRGMVAPIVYELNATVN